MDSTILLITNDEAVRGPVREACGQLPVRLELSDHLDHWHPSAAGLPDLVLCDYPALQSVRQRWPRAAAVLYADKADAEQAITAITRGALDYLIKPLAPDTVSRVLDSALRLGRDILVPAVYEKSEEDRAVARIIGQSPAMKEVYKLIGLIAPRDINVLITGESGTGKELVARALLHHSPRRDKPFLAVNCAAIPETLLESELFGHEKGAFTGADMRRVGKFEQCGGGTLLLDEIGDIPLPTQAKLLRVLQDGTFQRLGGTQTIRCDVRILAATHQPLEELIARRQFRQDLYYRLKVASLHVPPLREREVDVVLLAHHFVNACNRQLGTSIQRFAPETLPLLLAYPWPGNVRELENAIKSALVVARGSVLRPEFLPEVLRQAAGANHTLTLPLAPNASEVLAPKAAANGRTLRDAVGRLLARHDSTGQLHRNAMDLMERAVIQTAVEHTGGNMAGAARLLGISRTTLRAKMEHFELNATVRVTPKRPEPVSANGPSHNLRSG